MKKQIFTALVGILIISLPAFAVTIHIPGDYPTIQAGIDAAVDGDTVLVANGTYTGNGNKNLDFTGKAIVVISENGADNCIINCEGHGRGFIFISDETSSSVLSGFTITNGYVTGISPFGGGGGILCCYSSPTIENSTLSGNSAFSGGGIYCDNSSPTIENCTLSVNLATNGLGGGIGCDSNSSPTIENCTISGNLAISGGGISCWDDSNPTIENCTLSGNPVVGYGGGIYCDNSSPTITNCTINGNSAGFGGGGIYCYGSSPTIQNCTLSGNSADYSGGGILCNVSSPTGVNNIIWRNIASIGNQINGPFSCAYSDIQGGWHGTGNIDADPLFVTGPGGDYYLSQTASGQAVTSPCVDAGDPASPMIVGTTRTDGVQDAGVVDMGYHYSLPTAYPAVEYLVISISGQDVLLDWSEMPLAAGYHVYRNEEPYFEIAGMTPIADPTTNSYIDENAVSGAFYYAVTVEY
ncbi:MAG: right-handed parallel beta-helix repeat-containing protein [candidate division Zixibacteria bacterium]|nr:right-handed parallel beta-helix repeat-containing protein [Candidatus Tariuqbacter arcticus]